MRDSTIITGPSDPCELIGIVTFHITDWLPSEGSLPLALRRTLNYVIHVGLVIFP